MPFRYRRIAYVALNVTDLERSIPFYRDVLGLELVSRKDDVAFFRCTDDHHSVVLHRAPERGLRRLGFEVEDVDAALAHFEGLSPELVSDSERTDLGIGEKSFRVREPKSGLLLEYFDSFAKHGEPFVPTVAQIVRLGHVVLGVTDLEATQKALVDDFGFRVSDFVEGRFAFLRCFPNPLHHSLAIGKSPENHLHHVNFMVTEIDDVGRAIHRLKKNDVKVVFGPGRHPPSGSVFLYFLDPDGMTVEYSFGMEEFPEENPRAPRQLEAKPSSLDTWGAIPDELFGKSGPIEQAR